MSIYRTHPIVDDSYPDDTGANTNDPYALKRLYLAPGPQHLNGEQALEYVRSRHADLVGRYRAYAAAAAGVEALKTKLNATNVINNLSQLIKDIRGKVYTDLSEQEMIQFATYAHGLNSNAIQRLLGPGSGGRITATTAPSTTPRRAYRTWSSFTARTSNPLSTPSSASATPIAATSTALDVEEYQRYCVLQISGIQSTDQRSPMIEQRHGEVRYLQFSHFQQFPAITHGVFTRHGGYSTTPYSGLNSRSARAIARKTWLATGCWRLRR